MEYKGITPEALFLLADNRFRNFTKAARKR